MNTSYIEILIAEENPIKTIRVQFDLHNSQKAYTYKTRLDVKPDDLVIVEAEDELKIVHVVEVCEEGSHIQPEDRINYKWAFQKVDLSKFEELNAESEKMIDGWKRLKKRKMKERILSENLDDFKQLKS